MSKYNRNSNKLWTSTEIRELRNLAQKNTPTRVIGLKLGRTVEAIYSKSSEKNINLRPVNQSPYSRRKN